jgi:hypothetical protein
MCSPLSPYWLPTEPSAYWAGTALYLITNGFCQPWFTALTVDIVGGICDASTLFGALNAHSAPPPSYA